MADRHADNVVYPRWLSISGEELDLDLPKGLLGKLDYLSYLSQRPDNSSQENAAPYVTIRN